MRRFLVLAIGLLSVSTPSQAAEPGTCQTTMTAAAACDNTAGEESSSVSAASPAAPQAPEYTYKYLSRCKAGEGCVSAQRTCQTDSGDVGAWYVVRRIEIATGEAVNLGATCLAPQDAEERDVIVITPAMVLREFERLDWPVSQLELQPPDGQTLINFDTNFFTDNTEPTTRTVTLLGQQVQIEATPSEYTWDHGDGTTTTTTTPGAAYPDLEVTHEYAEPGRVSPSVATTYAGRYRINGGAWQQIPGTLTLPGEPVELQVRSASPRLVGSY